MTIDNKYTTQKSLSDIKKLDDERANFMIKCSHCGHTMTMYKVDRTICSHCGHWVYKTPEAKFKYKLKEKMIKNAKDKR